MKAIIWTDYGSPAVLELREVTKPTPKDNEVLVKIHAATVTAGDCEMRSLKFPLFLCIPMRVYMGFIRPTRVTIPGMELAGEIEAVGNDVTRYKVGDKVFGSPGFGMGAYAEYICLPEIPKEMDGLLVNMPANMSYAEAACVFVGGIESLHFLRKANIQVGEKLLINGAGGSIGTFGIQLSKHYGAEVTAVDSGPKLEMMRSIGADHVIDYSKEDFTVNGNMYDVIFDVIGKSNFGRSMRSLTTNGRYLIANPRLSTMLRAPLASINNTKNVIIGSASQTAEDLNFLAGLIEVGTIRSVIDKEYTLEDVAEAHWYVESGEKQGNVVINVV